MGFRVYDTPWTADWLAHATQEHTHDSTRDGTVCTEYSSRSLPLRLWNFCLSVPVPCPSQPTSRKRNPAWDNTFWLLDSQVFGWRGFPPEGWVFFICFCILVYSFFVCVFVFVFWWKNKGKQEKENKHRTCRIKVLLSFPASLCVVSAPRPGLSSCLLVFRSRVRVGRLTSVSVQCALQQPVPLPYPLFPLWLLSLGRFPGCWSTFKKKTKQNKTKTKPLPSPTCPPVSLCPCVSLATDKEKYELVFLL